MRPFIQLSVCETKENVSSGTWIMENLNNTPAAAPVFKRELLMPYLHFAIKYIVYNVALAFVHKPELHKVFKESLNVCKQGRQREHFT